MKRFIPGEFGSDLHSTEEWWLEIPLIKIKLDIAKYLEEKEKEGLTWTGITNGPFFDW